MLTVSKDFFKTLYHIIKQPKLVTSIIMILCVNPELHRLKKKEEEDKTGNIGGWPVSLLAMFFSKFETIFANRMTQ